MSLSIYTYSNPYEINNEPYWESIKYAAHFCVSQTMVNGLEAVYSELQVGQLTTVELLTEALYSSWDDTKTYIEQYAALSDILQRAKYKGNDEDKARIRQALGFNKKRMLDSIRLLAEMNIILYNIKIRKLTEEQKYLVAAYRSLMKSEYKDLFTVKAFFKEKEIDSAINKALHDENDKKGIALDAVDCDTVVFHGIHQFTPVILNAIEQVARYKRVVMLFNYQEQYKEIYQTWLDVYSCFDLVIKSQFNNEFHPNTLLPISYKGNVLADSIGKLANGEITGKNQELEGIEAIEFDNITEFSAYVATKFENAQKEYDKDKNHGKRSALSYMTEQFYAAENSVNDILKVYFPEQFGERHFLAYPIGHFFIAVTNMWNAEKGGIHIENLDDISECLFSEALPEKRPGELITTFNIVKNYLSRDGATTLEGIIQLIEKLKKQAVKVAKDKTGKLDQLKLLGYYDVDEESIDDLLFALKALDKITRLFYEDFEKDENNFRNFYIKIREFVEQQILPGAEAEEEFKDIIVRLLARLEEVEKLEVKGTFDCLKDTMSYYLKQESQKGRSANWIVRDFQQIDGDVLQSSEQAGNVTYHFACVSDADMNVKREDQFPWPLNIAFFENAYEPLDWKYQVYIKSRREFKHFKRYALVYGLEFNRCDFKISYVKNTDDKENELFYLLRLLGIKPDGRPYQGKENKTIKTMPYSMDIQQVPFSDMDCYRKKICPYRFALESIIEDGTRFKDRFLLRKYFEVILENNVRRNLVGQMASEAILMTELNNEANRLVRYFKFMIDSEKLDIISNARNYIFTKVLKNGQLKQFPNVSPVDSERMKKREIFLVLRLENDEGQNVLNGKFEVTNTERDRLISPVVLKSEHYDKKKDLWCQWCADREICLAPYMTTTEI